MRQHIWRIVLLTVILVVAGCSSAPTVTNLTPAYLQLKPQISTYQDPSTELSDFRTFSVFPASLISKKVKMNEIMDKQMLFFVRNLFEARGYRFVKLDQKPDFLVTLTASSQYKETYVPPQTVTVPRWVPGQTITSYGNSSGTFDYNTYGSYSSYGWGTYTGTSTSTTHVPGYLTTDTYTQPGYNVGYYYPFVTVAVYNAKTMKNIWLGTGIGTSTDSDVRVSSQLIFAHMVSQFPAASQQTISTSENGVVGIRFLIFTPDGNNYLPTVIQIADNSPAKRAGVKLYDMILAVNGVSLVNKPIDYDFKELTGKPGSKADLEIWRVDHKVSITVTRTTRSTIH